MFINELSKKEAVAFLGLVKGMTVADHVFADEEDKLLEEYIEELGLENEIIRFFTVNEAISLLSGSKERIKNIVYFELLGLALVDGEFAEDEINILNHVAGKFEISKEKQTNYLNYFKEVKSIYDKTDIKPEHKIEVLRKRIEELLA